MKICPFVGFWRETTVSASNKKPNYPLVRIDVIEHVLAPDLPMIGEEDGNVIRALGIFPLAMV